MSSTTTRTHQSKEARKRADVSLTTFPEPHHKALYMLPQRITFLLSLLLSVFTFTPALADATVPKSAIASVDDFLVLVSGNSRNAMRALERIEEGWHPGNRAMLVETYVFTRDRRISSRIIALLERKTGKKLGDDARGWFGAIWNTPHKPHPDYASFKTRLYENIDPRFREYFSQAANATIRLDEIRWGGVVRDGIPPLKNPLTLPASEAEYLSDTDVVFGVVVNGEARAYPKRILAWHEMVKDVVGGTPINGVYCTLCGSMIVYLPEHNGVHHELGTSGFLYRSNKLMYDHRTKSMWSTIKGEPVVGPLVGKGIKLEPHHVVTTTWGKWKTEHPKTRVLSLDTGHRRNYGEGVAYRDYFATDELMFTVPKTDDRLLNKDEVFIVRAGNGVAKSEPLAISSKFLKKNPVYHDKIGDLNFVVITDETGASRAYKTEARLSRSGASDWLVAQNGSKWTINDDALTTSTSGQRSERLPAHRAFWFGWQAVYPETRLVK